jgi:hypothetical protein
MLKLVHHKCNMLYSLPPVVCEGGACVFFTLFLCLFVCDGVQHVLCCVFIRLVYPMLSVSLDFPFVIALSVFSEVHLSTSTTGL